MIRTVSLVIKLLCFFLTIHLIINTTSLTAGEIIENESYGGKKITVKYAQYGEAGEIEYSKIIFRKFVKIYPHIRIDFSVYPWGQYWAKLQIQSGSGLAPDVMMLFSGIMGIWVSRGALLPLDDFIRESNINLDDYHSVGLKNCKWDNKFYTFPIDIPVRTIIYKTDKLEQSGIPKEDWPKSDEAMTFDEFKSLIKKLTLRNPDGTFAQYGMVGGLAWNDIMFRMYGGKIYDRQVNPTRSVVLENDSFEKAVIEVFKLQYGDRVHLGDIPLRGSNINLSSLLYNEKFAVGIDGPWTLRNLERDGVRYGLTRLPQATHPSQVLDVNSVGIYSGTNFPEESWLLVQYLASHEVQSLLGKRLRGMPSLKSASVSLINNDYGAKDCEAFIYDLPLAEPNVISNNNYLIRVVEKWRLRVESILSEKYEKRLRNLPRIDGIISDIDYTKFISYMNNFIENTVSKKIIELDKEINAAITKGEREEPNRYVKFIFPVILLFLILSGFRFYLKFIKKNKKETFHPVKSVRFSGYSTISPWLIGFLLFIVGPILAAIVLSFTDWNLIKAPTWTGFQNYIRLFNDSNFLLGMEKTFLYAVLVIPISLLGGLFTAGLLTYNIRGSDFFKAVFYFPSLFTGAAAAVLYINMFNMEYGIINHILSFFNIPPVNWLDETHAFYTVVLMNVFWIGGAMIIYYAGMKQIPKSLYEAAEIDGAGFFRKFTSITIPQLAPVIVFMLVITTIGAFQVFTPALFFAEGAAQIGDPGDSLRFYSVNIYDEAFNKLNMGYACSYALILFIIIFIVTMIQMKFSKKFVDID
ncbi:extracellular solute-binding protein [Bacteroidota bacterium]